MMRTIGAGAMAGIAARQGSARDLVQTAALEPPTPLPMREVAPGVFCHFSLQEEAGPGNEGEIANLGFILGQAAVLVVDSGASARQGRRLRAAIRAQTDLPIRYVIATHVHPDHLFGHAAFKADPPAFVGHARLPAALAARGPYYLDNLARVIGEAAAGTELVPPDLLVEDRLRLDLGDRPITLVARPTAHTDNDLTVQDEASGTLFAGDLLFIERCPVIDGSLLGWLALHDVLAAEPAATVIPGHGPAVGGFAEASAGQKRYLVRLRDAVRAFLAEGGRLEDATEVITMAEERDRWLLFDQYHRRNVTAAYAELEWE
jgi:quinoprotein relay system zinc metallohydrolase 2